ncbi:hypothetical protein MKX41_10595 [Paenibacillus sp. FSL R5-0475]|uniref:hypothetical protein n=1 Tax=Paenibacillus sp. FSL R5-0475 TaxID=2921643 RepID=UPI0030F77C06
MTQLAVKAWVFNPELLHQHVRISGNDGEGETEDFRGVVTEISGDKITVNSVFESNKRRYYLSYFYDEGLKMEVWDKEPTVYKVSEEYVQETCEDEG